MCGRCAGATATGGQVHSPRVWLAVGALLAAATLFVFAFSTLPLDNSGLAIDWKVFWHATHAFQLDYSSQLVFTPPWGLAMLWPLSWMPLATSWGLVALITLFTLALAAVRHSERRSLWAGVLLCASYPAVRQLADGNIEFLVIAGAMLLLWALPRQHVGEFALGTLMCSSKLQESWLLLAIAGLIAWRQWPVHSLLRMLVCVLVPAFMFLAWRGSAWLDALEVFPFAGTQIDASLHAVAGRLGLPVGVYVAALVAVLAGVFAIVRRSGWQLHPLQAGSLLAAGLLLAPYAASNSVLGPLALALPVGLSRGTRGVLLLAAANLPYLLIGNAEWRLTQESNYWALVLMLVFVSGLIPATKTKN